MNIYIYRYIYIYIYLSLSYLFFVDGGNAWLSVAMRRFSVCVCVCQCVCVCGKDGQSFLYMEDREFLRSFTNGEKLGIRLFEEDMTNVADCTDC